MRIGIDIGDLVGIGIGDWGLGLVIGTRVADWGLELGIGIWHLATTDLMS